MPDDLLREAKIRAAGDGVTLKQFFVAAVRDKLAPQNRRRHRRPPPVISTGGPVVHDLSDEEMEEAMFGPLPDVPLRPRDEEG